jgi:hypothetical protein
VGRARAGTMGKFVSGLILGVVLGVAATAYRPNLPEDARVALAHLTARVMRGIERAAEAVGGAADRTAEEAGEAAREGRAQGASAAGCSHQGTDPRE